MRRGKNLGGETEAVFLPWWATHPINVQTLLVKQNGSFSKVFPNQ